MSTFPGLTAVIEAELARFNIRAASQSELSAAIARAVVEFVTTDEAFVRMGSAFHRHGLSYQKARLAAIRAALGEENTDG